MIYCTRLRFSIFFIIFLCFHRHWNVWTNTRTHRHTRMRNRIFTGSCGHVFTCSNQKTYEWIKIKINFYRTLKRKRITHSPKFLVYLSEKKRNIFSQIGHLTFPADDSVNYVRKQKKWRWQFCLFIISGVLFETVPESLAKEEKVWKNWKNRSYPNNEKKKITYY